VFWREQMVYGTRIDSDRYFVTSPKHLTIEDVLMH